MIFNYYLFFNHFLYIFFANFLDWMIHYGLKSHSVWSQTSHQLASKWMGLGRPYDMDSHPPPPPFIYIPSRDFYQINNWPFFLSKNPKAAPPPIISQIPTCFLIKLIIDPPFYPNAPKWPPPFLTLPTRRGAGDLPTPAGQFGCVRSANF